MSFKKCIIALSLVAGTVSAALPEYRLVSGERGVILSVSGISAEPEVKVEDIDGNLAINIAAPSRSTEFENTIIFPDGFWADSLVEKSSEGTVLLTFHNFSLSNEDMQKKYDNGRLLLLISQVKAPAFDRVLIKVGASGETVVENVSATNRDGLEFVTLSGANFSEANVTAKDSVISLSFSGGLKTSEKTLAFPEAMLVDSAVLSTAVDGNPALDFYLGEGTFSFFNAKDETLTLTFKDNREKDSLTVVSWDGSEKPASFVMDETRGVLKEDVVETAEEDVTSNAPVVSEDNKSDAKSATVVTEPIVEDIPAPLDMVLFIIKNDVNVRSTPNTKTRDNIVAKVGLGTRVVASKKEGAWYKGMIGDTIEAWVYKTLVADSADITDEQWDAIYNNAVKDEAPVIDEFNSPGSDPLLADDKNNVFNLDSTKTIPSKKDSSSLKDPEVTKEDEVVIAPYKKYGRDPFLPLTTSDFVKPKLPKIDNLELVGIIYDPSESIALFEEMVDGDLVSKSMRAGTKVENGKLLKIYERKVVFLMHESDISYTVEKELLDKKE